MKFFCRLTKSYDELTGLFHKLTEESRVLVVYQHDADEKVSRTHVHYYIDTDISQDTIRNRVKKHLGYTPERNDWSFKTTYGKQGLPVDETCITYMSKGKLSPKWCHGIDDSDVDRLTNSWVEPTVSVVLKNGRLETETPARPTEFEMVQEVVRWAKENDIIDDASVVARIRYVLNKYRLKCGMYKVVDLFDTFMRYHDPNRFDRSVLGLISKRYV